MPGRSPNPATEHLINHELKIFRTWIDQDGKRTTSTKAGLLGHIKSPVISMQEKQANTARVTFEFERRADIKESPDSEFRHFVGEEEPELVKTNINDVRDPP